MKRKGRKASTDSMSTPAFGLNREYVAAMISLTPSSSPLLDCHTSNHSGNEDQGYEEGIADKVPVRWAWK